MNKAEQMIRFNWTISFYEEKIEKSICEKDFDIARVRYHEMKGACFLAERLGLLSNAPERNSRNSEWFRRIQDAQFGQRRR